jgi:hypothetical protein
MSKLIPFDLSELDICYTRSAQQASLNTSKKRRSQISRAPAIDKNMIDAMQYANVQMADPDARALYQSHAAAKGRTARSLALFDYLIAPTIRRIDATKYTGTVGELIRIRAVDDFMVVTIGVLICNHRGEVIERGAAVPQLSPDQWTYRITTWNDSLTGCSIVVSAHDVAGNIASQTLTLA